MSTGSNHPRETNSWIFRSLISDRKCDDGAYFAAKSLGVLCGSTNHLFAALSCTTYIKRGTDHRSSPILETTTGPRNILYCTFQSSP